MNPKIIEISKLDGRLKRIEYRGKYLRVSRTGGVALRAQGAASGINFTINSKHGTRISSRIAKGTNVGFQKGRFILRGRYGKGPIKLNISKSGVSVSSKTEIGSVNLFKPKYSSAKLGGVHFRGDNAIAIHAIILFLQFMYSSIKILFKIIFWFLNTLSSSLPNIIKSIKEKKSSQIEKIVKTLEQNWLQVLQNETNENLFCALFYNLIIIGKGNSEVSSKFIDEILHDYNNKSELEPLLSEIDDKNLESAVELTLESLNGHSIDQVILIELFFGSLAYSISQKVNSKILIEIFYALDYCILISGKRNILQERLLGVFADTCGIGSEELK